MTMKRNGRRHYGLIRDLRDDRDLFAAPAYLGQALPDKVDLREMCPPVYNQGSLGSCTANAAAALLQFTEKELTKTKRPIPSRLFIYYNTRVIQGTQDEDSGASIRNTLKAIANQGYCKETAWPYKIPNYDEEPDVTCYETGLKHKLGKLMYAQVMQDPGHIEAMIAASNPIEFGFSVKQEFENVGKDGIIKMPAANGRVLGGHAILIVGYWRSKGLVLIRNSWGTSYGMAGYAWMPYDYVFGKLASDFWTINQVPTPEAEAAAA